MSQNLSTQFISKDWKILLFIPSTICYRNDIREVVPSEMKMPKILQDGHVNWKSCEEMLMVDNNVVHCVPMPDHIQDTSKT